MYNNTINEDFTLDVYEDNFVSQEFSQNQTHSNRQVHQFESYIPQIRNEGALDGVYIKEEPESQQIITNSCGGDLTHDASFSTTNGGIKTEMETEENALPLLNVVSVDQIKEETVDYNEDIIQIEHDVHFGSQLCTSGLKVDISTTNSSLAIDISHSNTTLRNRAANQNFLHPYDSGGTTNTSQRQDIQIPYRPINRTLVTIKLNNNPKEPQSTLNEVSPNQNQNEAANMSSESRTNSTSSSESSEESDDEPPRPVQKGLRKEPIAVQSENNINDVVKKLLFSKNNSKEEEQLGQKLMDLLSDDDSEGESRQAGGDNHKKISEQQPKRVSTGEKQQSGRQLKRASIVDKQQRCRNASGSKKITPSKSRKDSVDGLETPKTHLVRSNSKNSVTSSNSRDSRRRKESESEKQNTKSSKENQSIRQATNRSSSESSSTAIQERLVDYLNKNVESLISRDSATFDKESSDSSDSDNDTRSGGNILTEVNHSTTPQTSRSLTDNTQTTQNRFDNDCRKITSSLESVSKKLDMLKQTVNGTSQSRTNQKPPVSSKTNVAYRNNKRSTSVDQRQNHFPPKKKSHTEIQHSTSIVSEISTNVVQPPPPETPVIMSEHEMNDTYHTVNDFLKGMLNPDEDATNLPTFLGQVYFKGYESGLQDKFCVQGRRGRGRRGGGGPKTV